MCSLISGIRESSNCFIRISMQPDATSSSCRTDHYRKVLFVSQGGHIFVSQSIFVMLQVKLKQCSQEFDCSNLYRFFFLLKYKKFPLFDFGIRIIQYMDHFERFESLLVLNLTTFSPIWCSNTPRHSSDPNSA